MAESGRRLITLVSQAQARKGERFRARMHPKCASCKIYSACAKNLREGFAYEVVEVRGIVHTCPLTGTKMVAAVVVELPIEVSVPKHLAVEGLRTSNWGVDCGLEKCRNHAYCRPGGIGRGEKVKVVKVLKRSLDCPLGRELSLVLALPSG